MANTLIATVLKNRPLTASFATRWIDTAGSYMLLLQMSTNATGAPAGTFTVEESNDPQADFETRSTDGDSTASTAAAVDVTADPRVKVTGSLTVAGAASAMVAISTPGRFIRLKYTRTSGGAGGACQLWAVGKD
jgi:hypothetical protein